MEERKTIEDLKTESPEQYEAMMRNKRFEELGWYVLYVTALHERQFLEGPTRRIRARAWIWTMPRLGVMVSTRHGRS